MDRASFNHRLATTPETPGVYIMKDARDRVLYVGKANNLRNRVGYYFGSPYNLPMKIRTMASRIADYEFIITHSSAEALILENTLIKKHKPPFNARLKDDKTYPFLKIDLAEDFPQIYITRRVENDGAVYFGPFATAHSIRKTLALLKKLFPYRSCTKVITGKDARPCLEYFINRCAAPCTGEIDKENYHKIIDQVVLFMEGKTEPVLADLKQKMQEASDALEFERAAVLRDQTRAIQRVSEEQQIKTASASGHDLDAIGMATQNDQACLEVFFVRNGKLIGRDTFVMDGTQDDSPERVMTGFVKQFYQSTPFIPKRILLQHRLEEADEIQQWLREKRGGAVTISMAQRGPNRRLVEMASANAIQQLSQMRVKWWSNTDAQQEAMTELQEELSLPTLPRTIECYDISNIQGTTPVGSMVVFEDGRPKSSHYRRFSIKTVEGIDDYAMMQEMLRRRFRRMGRQRDDDKADAESTSERGGQQKQSWGVIPDLVLIDGGKGHLNAVVEVLLELGVDDVPLASLAKENEEIFVRDTPESILLPRNSPALYLVQRLRDEAHRFAVTYHQRSRTKKGMQSALDAVPGIGPKRKRTLLRRFGSARGVKEASLEELSAIPGMTRTLAQKVKEHL
jgi:excinuclease ABC subunit C